ncbi:MAG: FAD-dependent oxidoreductase [Oscillospiraceae bacterium]|nr:FAD-dependent oxidoreductase [Mogibacterium sp.]MBR0343051.1 FAD-dependent oxidoreductase [Oscillospiraceae bacterium]
MQAAITSAELGHDVTLYEASGKLGGQWLLAAVPPHKERFNTQTYWMTRELDSKGVKVLLNTAFDEETAASEKYDAVIVATGSRPVKPPIPGIDLPNVVQAHDVLRMDVKLARGENIVVIGGGSVGSETAAYLAAHCNQVTILEMVDTIAADNGMKRAQLMATLQQLHVNAVTGAKVTSTVIDYLCGENVAFSLGRTIRQ